MNWLEINENEIKNYVYDYYEEEIKVTCGEIITNL